MLPTLTVADPSLQMNQMFLTMAASQGCARLKGRFVALPDPASSNLEGPAGGVEGGRLLVEECAASVVENNQLFLHIAGPGWQWVDRAELQNRVMQYVYVRAALDLQGPLVGTYDANAKLVSVYLFPRAAAHVAAIRNLPISVHATSILGAAADIFVDTDARVRERVATEGTSVMEGQFQQGVTFTFRLDTGQGDVAMGRLPPGVAPLRPFIGAQSWVLNERQALHPGGITVAGPFEAGVAHTLDALIETGQPLNYRAVCNDVAVSDLHGFFAHQGFTPLLMNHPETRMVPTGQRVSLVIPPMPCRWVLVTGVPTAPATIARLQLRVASN